MAKVPDNKGKWQSGASEKAAWNMKQNESRKYSLFWTQGRTPLPLRMQGKCREGERQKLRKRASIFSWKK